MKRGDEQVLLATIEYELALAESLKAGGDYHSAFSLLERAQFLGQASTYQHTRIHWRVFKIAINLRSPREIWGQIVRIVGASTKTPFGIYPRGNTGGANVWFFKTLPIPEDSQEIITKR